MSKPSAILLELHYLPSIQYISKFVQFEQVIIEQQENYHKSSYRNRCHIASANGMMRLSVPLVKGKNSQQNIQETTIAWYENWTKKHWQAIRSGYGNSPFFEYYADELKPFFEKKYDTLFDWNKDLLFKILELLDIETTVTFTTDFVKETDENILDFRNKIAPKIEDLAYDSFFELQSYPQVFTEKHGFLPNLSILDLLFCAGPESVAYL